MPLGILASKAPVRVQPFFGFRNADRLHLAVRALRRNDPKFDARGFWRSLKVMLRQYASREVAGMEVRLTFETGSGTLFSETCITDDEGFAHFEIALDPSYDRPLNTAWERAIIEWTEEGEAARQREAFILAPGREAGLGIISDIDDTILETGITGNVRAILRNWKRVLAQMPGQRDVVPGAPEFYADLSGRHGAWPDALLEANKTLPQSNPRPVFYVSSSPWNLFSYLVTFKTQRAMPIGPIALRDWGLNRTTLGSKGHGSHKEVAITRILATYPDLKFVLVGDDTQKDMIVFGKIGAANPERIAAVFIRRISQEPLNGEELSAQRALDTAGVPLWTGANFADAQNFLAKAGLRMDSEVETLIDTVATGTIPSESRRAGYDG